jgi:hypothetical protein
MYKNKTMKESILQNLVDHANLTDQDFRNLYWQLWGAFACHPETSWNTFENITIDYLENKKR